ncbi:MAG TPA: alpha-amylase family glycosyl hydrolase [Chthonomonadaceae bacterium]|nr:alpha-amylase family glycosyl hydrolase [Chthonomonadaceae bacterium]
MATATGPSVHGGMGAILQGGVCSFRLWAPNASNVLLVGDFTQWETNGLPLTSEQNGYWSADVTGAQAGQAYKFIIQNRGGSDFNQSWRIWRVDAYAREVANSGEEANGFVVDPGFPFSSFTTPGFENFLVYELHVGSFAGYHDDISVGDNHTATFADIIPKLGYIRELGFNAVLLMPVEQTLADIGLGYAPTNWFSPDEEYGGPKLLRQFVEAAHQHGLSVLLDVVYNHASTEDNRYWDYDGMFFDGGIYFENGGDTPFGRSPAHWKEEIRNFFLDNARMWFREYNVDGLRFDAVHYIQDESVRHIVMNGLHQEFPNKYLVAEYFKVSPDPIRSLGFDAIWDGDAPFAFRDAAQGNDPLDKVKSFLGWGGFDHAWNYMRYLLGSHDQIDDLQNGKTHNRYFVELYGGRDNWFARAKARLGWALNVAIPGTPMLFMGSECHMWGYWQPDPDAFGDHRFDWAIAGDPIGMGMRNLVADANQVRWNNPALRSDTLQIIHEDDTNHVIAFKRWNNEGNIVVIIVNLGDGQWQFGDYGVSMGGETGFWEEIFNSQSPQYGGWSDSGNYSQTKGVAADTISINLPKWSVLMFRKL